MSKERTVENLVQGSRNIDRMVEEIKTIVGMLAGLVLTTPAEVDRAIGRGNHLREWVFSCEKALSFRVRYNQGALTVRGIRIFEHGIEVGIYSYDRLRHSHESGVSASSALILHAALPTFIAKMVETFPGLEERLKPFLEAAEMKL